MGMSKNGNGPANSTYPFRCAKRFAQRTMSTNNETLRSEFQSLKKKSNTCNFIMVINRLMAVLNFPNSSHLPLKTTVETYTVQHRYTNALSAAISMHRQR